MPTRGKKYPRWGRGKSFRLMTQFRRGPNAITRDIVVVNMWLPAITRESSAGNRGWSTFVWRLYRVLSTCNSVCSTSNPITPRCTRATQVIGMPIKRVRFIQLLLAFDSVCIAGVIFFNAIQTRSTRETQCDWALI